MRYYFYLFQIIFGLGAIFIWAYLYFRSPPSSFKLREADRLKKNRMGGTPKNENSKEPLLLEGFQTEGTPHEILGLKPEATPELIQRRYRELMKRYHPDRVGRPGSREWKDAQKIAESINRAKDELLKNKK